MCLNENQKLADYSLPELNVLKDAVLYKLENCRFDGDKIWLNAWVSRLNRAIEVKLSKQLGNR